MKLKHNLLEQKFRRSLKTRIFLFVSGVFLLLAVGQIIQSLPFVSPPIAQASHPCPAPDTLFAGILGNPGEGQVSGNNPVGGGCTNGRVSGTTDPRLIFINQPGGSCGSYSWQYDTRNFTGITSPVDVTITIQTCGTDANGERVEDFVAHTLQVNPEGGIPPLGVSCNNATGQSVPQNSDIFWDCTLSNADAGYTYQVDDFGPAPSGVTNTYGPGTIFPPNFQKGYHIGPTTPPGNYTVTLEVRGYPTDSSQPQHGPASTNLSFTVTAPATYSYSNSPTSLSFSATQNGSTPGSQFITVTNTGNQILTNITASGNVSWLSVSPGNINLAPGASTAVSVQPNTTNLSPNTYSGQVNFSHPNAGSRSTSVSYTVNPAPVYSYSNNPTSLSYSATQNSATPGAQFVTITNTGNQPLNNLTISSNVSWLTVSPTSVSLGVGNSTSINAAINTTNLSPGTYSGTITFSHPQAGTRTTSVSYTVNVAPIYTYTNSPSSLSFSATQNSSLPGGQTVTLTNTGNQPLNSISASPNVSWINLSPSSVNVGVGSASSITVSVNTTALAPGTYSGAVTFSHPQAGSHTTSVSYTVNPAPVYSYNNNPTSLSYSATQNGALPGSQAVTLTNTGNQTLNSITASSNASWLTVNPTSLNVGVGSSGTVTTLINTTNLSPGNYTGTITFSHPQGGTRTTSVSYTVNAPAVYSYTNSPASLSYSATQNSSLPGTQFITITNTGNQTLNNITASPSVSWLNVSPGTFTLTPGASTAISVQPNTTNLSPATYNGQVNFSHPQAGGRSTLVSYTITAAPTYTYTNSPTSVSYSATQNGSLPGSQTITLTNTGNQNLNGISASSNASWLSVNPTSLNLNTGSSGTVTASINTTNLSPGTYTGTITFSHSQAGTRTTSVTYTISTAPTYTYTISPSSFSFSATQNGSIPGTQFITVTNTGNQTLNNITASGNVSWLNVSPGTFSLSPGASTAVSVQPNTTSMATGTYSGTVTFGHPNAGNQTTAVSYTVSTAPTYSYTHNPISLSYSATQNGGLPGSQSVTLTNTGNQSLNGISASSNVSWLTVNPTSINVGVGSSGTVTTLINTTNLSPGNYTGTITFSHPQGGTRTTSVSYTVSAAPVYSYTNSPSSLSFSATQNGATPGSQFVTITNTGNQTLSNITASPNVSWLNISPGIFSLSPGASTAVSVQPNNTNLSPNTYSGQVSFSHPNAGNQNTAVSYTVNAPSAFSYTNNPGSLSFSATQNGSFPGSQSVSLSNTGNQTLNNISASSNVSWLTVSPTSVSLGVGNSSSVTASINTTNLSPGTYSGTITFSHPQAGTRTTSVSYTVSTTPTYSYTNSPSSLSFAATQNGTTPGAQFITITNTGNQTLNNITASPDVPWLNVSPGIFSLAPGASTAVSVQPNTTSLSAGTYNGQVNFSHAQAGNRSTGVSYTVSTGASYSYTNNPSSLSFSATQNSSLPGSQTITLTNTGNQALSVSVSDNASWMDTSPAAVSLPTNGSTAVITVSINTTNLAPNTYTGTVNFAEPNAGTRTTSVSYTVSTVPIYTYSVSVSSLSFSATQNSATPGAQFITITNTGNQTLNNITVSGNVSWLSVSPGTFSLAPGASTAVSAQPNTTGLSPATYNGQVNFSHPNAGNHSTSVSYVVGSSSGCPNNTPQNNFEACGYTGTNFNTFNSSFTESTIDHNYGTGGPNGLSDNFSIRWKGRFNSFSAGNYQFTTVSDDGVRLYVNGALVIDNWTDHASTTNVGNAVMNAGNNDITLEYYENTGGSRISLSWAPISGGGCPNNTPQNTFEACVYTGVNYKNFDASGYNSAFTESGISHFYGSGGPNGLDDQYAIRWRGRFNTFSGGTYRFTTVSDDGVRLYVNGALAINNWTDHGTTTDNADVVVNNGNNDIILEFYENGGNSTITMSWSQISAPPTAPSNLTVDNTTQCGQIRLSWTDNSTNEFGFHVWRAPYSGGPQLNYNGTIYGVVASYTANVTSHTDTPPAGSSYSYVVTSFNNNGESSVSSGNAVGPVFNNSCSPNLSLSSKDIYQVFQNGAWNNYTGQTIYNGDLIKFRVVIGNNGNSPAYDVYVEDTLSVNLIYQPGSAKLQKGSGPNLVISEQVSGATIYFDAGRSLGDKLADGTNWLLTFDVKAQSSATQPVDYFNNTARIYYSLTDGGTQNNSVNVSTGQQQLRAGPPRVPDIKEIN